MGVMRGPIGRHTARALGGQANDRICGKAGTPGRVRPTRKISQCARTLKGRSTGESDLGRKLPSPTHALPDRGCSCRGPAPHSNRMAESAYSSDDRRSNEGQRARHNERVSARSDDLFTSLVERLFPLPSERVVVSALFSEQTDQSWRLSHASALVGPPRMGLLNWGQWAQSELAPKITPPPDFPGTFAVVQDGLMAVRQTATVRQATRWLHAAVSTGRLPALGALPRGEVQLESPRAPVLARPGNATPASRFVTETVRPVTGFLFSVAEPKNVAVSTDWAVGSNSLRVDELLGIDASTELARVSGEPAPAGILFGRVSRQAWIARIAYRHHEEVLHVWLRMESARVDPYDLELEIREYVGGDLADSRRLRLADVPLPARIRGRLGLRLPTLGREVQRTIRLYRRDGELLDEQREFSFVERIKVDMEVDGSRGPALKVGDWRPSPGVTERLADLDRVEDQYRSWLARGARRRVVSGIDVTRALQTRLARAKRELLVIDSYFGNNANDWTILDDVKVPIRILTGWQAHPPPTPRLATQARKWTTSPIPYHDRFYLWTGGGLNVGTSANGLAGVRLFRIDELSLAEVSALRLQFNSWWGDSRATPL